MDRASLEQSLEHGLPLREIGRRAGLHESTVSYWVKRHGLQAVNGSKHAARGALAREDLESLIEAGASIAQIAEAVGRSKTTVRHWLRRYGLRASGRPGAPARDGARQARAADLTRAPIKCPQHGLTEHIREPRGYYRCRQCRIEAVARRRQKTKRILVEEAGGCCRLCGYDRCLAALEFHHLVPAAKGFGVARRGAHSIARLRVELRKCVLLCSNCHAEVEAGVTDLP
jgi:IS30 family transposase